MRSYRLGFPGMGATKQGIETLYYSIVGTIIFDIWGVYVQVVVEQDVSDWSCGCGDLDEEVENTRLVHVSAYDFWKCKYVC